MTPHTGMRRMALPALAVKSTRRAMPLSRTSRASVAGRHGSLNLVSVRPEQFQNGAACGKSITLKNTQTGQTADGVRSSG
jgi:hypothetical protein